MHTCTNMCSNPAHDALVRIALSERIADSTSILNQSHWRVLLDTRGYQNVLPNTLRKSQVDHLWRIYT